MFLFGHIRLERREIILARTCFISASLQPNPDTKLQKLKHIHLIKISKLVLAILKKQKSSNSRSSQLL